jgi:hypothetical protein
MHSFALFDYGLKEREWTWWDLNSYVPFSNAAAFDKDRSPFLKSCC